ncbi:MAG: hypothetical protein ACKOXU_06710 [Limnohabitans sp.]
MSACQPAASGSSAGAAAVVGADADAHGCKGSAGYVWSAVQQRCMRLFEDALSFDPHPDNPDQTLKAFVVLGPENGTPEKAELFLPQLQGPVALDIVKTKKSDARPVVLRNATEQVEVVRVQDMYVLFVKGQVQFTHDAVVDSPLSKI